ncbi:MAG: NTPase [Planctomycetota bacterium]|jgi:nucleoside-triphosphatase
MASECAKILLTGLPGCGKTTAIMKIVAGLASENVAGFYTQEIRERRVRKGFRWKRLDGGAGILAHVDIKSPFKVSKYCVDVAGFEASVVPVLDVEISDADLIVIDEIGKMECFSKKFVEAVRRLFDSDKSVLATIAQKGAGLISEIKNHPNAKLITLSRDNRDEMVAEIIQTLSFPGK